MNKKNSMLCSSMLFLTVWINSPASADTIDILDSFVNQNDKKILEVLSGYNSSDFIDKYLSTYLWTNYIYIEIDWRVSTMLERDDDKSYYISNDMSFGRLKKELFLWEKIKLTVDKSFLDDDVPDKEKHEEVEDKKTSEVSIQEPFVWDLENKIYEWEIWVQHINTSRLKDSIISNYNDINKNIWYYFWYNNYKRHFSYQDGLNINEHTQINQLPQKIYVKDILPELLKYFHYNLEDYISQNNDIKSEELADDEIIVIQRDGQGNWILWYYDRWVLQMTSYSSLWIQGNNTPNWLFRTTWYKQAQKVSYKYDNFPMPYSIQLDIIWNWPGHFPYFIHAGYTDGSDRSRWCIRLPGYFAKKLFQDVWDNVAVYISN